MKPLEPELVPLTCADLIECKRPGCSCNGAGAPKILISGSCHPAFGTTVVFDKATRTLELRCVCGGMFARVAVAGELVSGKEN